MNLLQSNFKYLSDFGFGEGSDSIGFGFGIHHIPNQSSLKRYQNPQQKCYYFWFLKINGCHIEILVPVSILTYLSSSASDSVSVHQISSKLFNPRQSNDVIAIFKMATVCQVGFNWRRIIGSRCFVLIYCLIGFIVSEIYIRFWLKSAHSYPLLGTPHRTHPIILTPKTTFIIWKHIFEPLSVKVGQQFNLGEKTKITGQDSQKQSHYCYFTTWEKPTLNRFTSKFACLLLSPT